MQIIDTHQHLWDLSRFHLAWVHSSPDLAILAKSHLPNDYAVATRGLNIAKTIYLEVDVAADEQGAEAAYVVGLCQDKESRVAAAVIGGHPGTAGFRPHVQRWLTESSVKGVRQVLQVAQNKPKHCLTPPFLDDIRWLGANGLSFDLCMRQTELADGATLIAACPQTKFILDHCGNPNVSSPDQAAWKRSIATIAKLPNVDCKLSGLVESAPPQTWSAEELQPFVEHVIDSFGIDRVTFGSNWPVCNLNGGLIRWVHALAEILAPFSDQDRQKIFHDNAVRIYRLENLRK